ncbi:MAG: histidine kinase [Treponema sp.]|jgi:signal transduction histidine kinase|nr:histidine kinase [Treponema sp.]
MEAGFRYGRAGTVLVSTMFLCAAMLMFTGKYVIGGSVFTVFDSNTEANRFLFYINFYVPFFLTTVTLESCLFFRGFFAKGFCFIIALAGTTVSVYVLPDIFTVNLCLFSACILVSAMAFNPPWNMIVSLSSIGAFIVLLLRPSYIGSLPSDFQFPVPAVSYFIALAFYLFTLAGAQILIRFFIGRLGETHDMISHLNMVGLKMVEFNHRLQEYVQNFGEEAVKQERLRFTRELHDSSGYVFTNIIAIADAAASWPELDLQKMHATLYMIRNQAREGLHRTRETLYMIRSLQDISPGSISTLYEMKKIFEEVIGIQVDIECGNMRPDYGKAMNTAITKIVQEAFTNSIRHGQASRIAIQFWEFPGSLSMMVNDNGIGAKQVVKGIGLAGMEERITGLGGSLEAYSPEEGGFRLKVEIPLVMTNSELTAKDKAISTGGGGGGGVLFKL